MKRVAAALAVLIAELPANMVTEIKLPPKGGMGSSVKHGFWRAQIIGPPIGEPIERLLREGHSQSLV